MDAEENKPKAGGVKKPAAVENTPVAREEAPAEVTGREETRLPAAEHIAHAREYHGVQPGVVAGAIQLLQETKDKTVVMESSDELYSTSDIQRGLQLFRDHKITEEN